MMLKERYQKEIVPQLMKELGDTNRMAIPGIKQISLSVGISSTQKDSKYLETIDKTLRRISGQKAVETKAKKSISGFKVREGMVVGKRVTLRGDMMWSFLEKLLTFTFPRITDFRGITTKIIDKSGNISIGFKEYLPFPEISPDEVEHVHGLQVTVTAKNAGSKERGLALYKALGFPFKD
ncbi:50S ribosomal protein L5 [Patescibacteria group bacterium]|nr:50S ribosomal protein L5 [Patescibacteria group bacterium]